MRKILSAIFCCLLLTVAALAGDVSIPRINTDCVVSENGDCRITQTVTLQVESDVSELTVPVGRNVSHVTVSGGESTLRRQDDCTYAVLSSQNGFKGEQQFVISYQTGNHVTAADNGQLFSVELISDLWEIPVERYGFTVVLPQAVESTPTFADGYHGEDAADTLTVNMQDRALSGVLRGGLLDRDSFTMTMTVPAGYFTGAAKQGSTGAGFWIFTVLVYILTGLAVFYWWKTLRCGRLHIKARTMPPEGITPGELPFLLAGKNPSFGLLLCHWGTLGYLHITISGSRPIICKAMDMGTERREVEQKIFAMLFRDGDTVAAGSGAYNKMADTASHALRQYWSRRIYDRASGNPLVLKLGAVVVAALAMAQTMNQLAAASAVKWLLIPVAAVAGAAAGYAMLYAVANILVRDWKAMLPGIGALLLCYILSRIGGSMIVMLPAVLLAAFTGYITRHGGKRTAEGNALVEQCLGFRRFLSHSQDSLQLQMLQRDPLYYYTMLIYAQSVGLGGQLARQSGAETLESCPWLKDARGVPVKPFAYYEYFTALCKTLNV